MHIKASDQIKSSPSKNFIILLHFTSKILLQKSRLKSNFTIIFYNHPTTTTSQHNYNTHTNTSTIKYYRFRPIKNRHIFLLPPSKEEMGWSTCVHENRIRVRLKSEGTFTWFQALFSCWVRHRSSKGAIMLVIFVSMGFYLLPLGVG